MAHSHRKNRRNFLRLSAHLAALGVTSLGVSLTGTRKVFAAEAATTTDLSDYKALVCIYLFGGNDGNNLIVPVDNTRYPLYKSLRGGLALSGAKLLPAFNDGQGNPWALHYGLPEINALYAGGQAAFVLNVGQLDQPLTRTQYLAGLNTPTNLFSHSDQTVQAQTGTTKPNGSGWGGRLLDCCGVNDTLAAISTSSPALFLQGFNVAGNAIPPGIPLGLAGMSFWPAAQAQIRKQAVDQLLLLDGGNTIRQTANTQMSDGLKLAKALQGTQGASNFTFPGTDIGKQLKSVAQMIQIQSSQGPGRQVFFASMGGYDLHSSQDWSHWDLLSTLSAAVGPFQSAINNLGLAPNVTLFTQSEFGRTLQPSGTGSDHAWGSHQIVVGGSVKPGVYGAYPTLALGGPDDANNRGVWIPTISTGQFGATLGKWFGASPADLNWAFPNLGLFPASDIGFMM